ncbi:hypothetical protein CLOM_g11336 [Closterium sp. NIES-68]|nr:hypothetical protein CLOM_g11336 [Closterium sp. NIES-68]
MARTPRNRQHRPSGFAQAAQADRPTEVVAKASSAATATVVRRALQDSPSPHLPSPISVSSPSSSHQAAAAASENRPHVKSAISPIYGKRTFATVTPAPAKASSPVRSDGLIRALLLYGVASLILLLVLIGELHRAHVASLVSDPGSQQRHPRYSHNQQGGSKQQHNQHKNQQQQQQHPWHARIRHGMFQRNPSDHPHSHSLSPSLSHSHSHSLPDAESASDKAAGAGGSEPSRHALNPASLSDWLQAHGWRISNPLADPSFREQDEEEEEGGWGQLIQEQQAGQGKGRSAAAGDGDGDSGGGGDGAAVGGRKSGAAASSQASPSPADSIPADANATFLRLLQQQGDYACALWLHNACYAFNPLFHSVPVANHEFEKIMLRERITDRHVGVWFWKDPRYDLSRLNLSENICTGRAALPPLRREHFSSADGRDLPELTARVGPFVHASDAELFFLHGRPPPDLVGAAAGNPFSVSNTSGSSTSSSSSSSSSSSNSRTIEQILQPTRLPYSSYAISLEQPEQWVDAGVVSLRDGHLGHFVEFVGGMTEVARHLPRDGDADDLQAVLFFPSGAGVSRWVAAAGAVAMRGPEALKEFQGTRGPRAMAQPGSRAGLPHPDGSTPAAGAAGDTAGLIHSAGKAAGIAYTAGAAHTAASPAVMVGRDWTHTTCFRDVFFPLSVAHTPSSADLFRLWVAQGVGLGPTLKAQQADPRIWTDEIERRRGGGRGDASGGRGRDGEARTDDAGGRKVTRGGKRDGNVETAGKGRKEKKKNREEEKGNEGRRGKSGQGGEEGKGVFGKQQGDARKGVKRGEKAATGKVPTVKQHAGVSSASKGVVRARLASHQKRHLLQVQAWSQSSSSSSSSRDLQLMRRLKAEGSTLSSREQQQQQQESSRGGGKGRGGRQIAYQITVVERKGVRTISNFRAMASLLRAVFPRLPVKVVSLEAMPFAAQVRAMHRTALLVSMHGASMANVVLLQRGAAALEIMPFMWHYGAYKRIALRFGVRYFMWRNEHRNLSSYTDNCLDANGFSQWQAAKCHTVTACRACIRDKVVTEVHLGELRSVLLAAREVVDQWELRRGTSFVELPDESTAAES